VNIFFGKAGFSLLIAVGMLSQTAIAKGSHKTNYEEQLIQRTEQKIRNAMKDPESARFSHVHLYWDDEGNGLLGDPARKDGKFPHVCGYVNAKNAFGGYVGFVRFNGTWVDDPSDEGEVRETFEKNWAKAPCSSDELEV